MLLCWKIRYLDRTDKQFKDRYLRLLTETLDPVTRAAIELITERAPRGDQRRLLPYKHLFQPISLEDLSKDQGYGGQFRSVGPSEYFENETGVEITLGD